MQTIISLELGSCTERAVQHFICKNPQEKINITYVKSFEEGIDLAMENEGYIIFIPHIHHLCNVLETDPHWESIQNLIFSLENPSLFLAERRERVKDDNSYAILPTLQGLLTEEDTVQTLVKVKNTQEGAFMVHKGICQYGITNESGIKKYQLSGVRELKKMIILWIPFRFHNTFAV
ncbi:MAG: hypothetical protein WCJ84_01325 [Candidatus Peregrinibacteria bacterium]